MKKGEENFSIVLSGVLALGIFFLLFVRLRIHLFLSIFLGAGTYVAFILLLKPQKRIGKMDLSSVGNGELLGAKFGEAQKDFARLKRAVMEIKEEELKMQCTQLLETAESILKYLADHPEKIMAARRYIDYYQETAANILENYLELQKTKLATKETEEIMKKTREGVLILKEAFGLQLQKLMENELMDMEADLNLLKQTLSSEGYTDLIKK